jgi:probable HAF family extracellular repeat protein
MTRRTPLVVILVALCVLAGWPGLGSAVSAQAPRTTIVDLGTLGGTRSAAHGVNNRGHVVGQSATSDGHIRAFVYRAGTLIDLGTLGGENSYAYRINDLGLIVGRAENAAGLSRAFVAFPGTPMFDIGMLDTRVEMLEFNTALGLNMRGQIVGYRHQPGDHMTPHNRVFRFLDNVLEDLGTFGGEDGIVTAINDAGQMAGSVGLDPHADYADRRAFITVGDKGVPLGTLGGRVSVALDLNQTGEVVGQSQIPSGEFHGFVFRANSLVDIGTLPGGRQSFAYGISRDGDVVGAAESSGSLRAVLFRNGVLTDLNTLLPAGSGWVLNEARAISDSGHIAGTGVINGQQRAFLLVLDSAR